MEAISADDPALKGQEDYGSDSGSVSSCSIASGGGPPPLASASGGSRRGGAATAGGGGTTAREDTIQVSVRLRPLNAKELARNDPFDWECINDTTIMFRNSLPERSMFPTTYTFDRVFRYDSTTKQVYEDGAKYVALSVVSGINASIFAYGQTSSGKTYTMTGITEYAMTDIYDYIQRHKEREFVLKFSAMEIYNEAVRDLLSADTTPLRLLDDHDRGTTVEKLTEETLRDWDHLKELLAICEAQRQIGETSLNETSSRSHQILRLSVESSAREFLGKDNSSSLAATVNFVDLAGSERASQAMSAGTRLKEGCHINRSLLTLGTVIRKLSKGRTGHVPYRDSKLTRILQHSLGGNARTAIICTMSPARSHVEQSRNTLLFASCAKEVATSAQVNVVMSDKALVKHLQKELTRLENELRSLGLNSNNSYADTLLKEKDAQIQKMEMEILELTHQRDLAQSRIEDLMRAAGDDEERELEDGLVQPAPTSYVLSICEEKLSSLYDPPSVPDFEFIETDHVLSHKFCNDDDASCNGGNYQVVMEKPNEHDATSTEESIGSPYLDGSAVNYRDEEIMSVDDCQDTKVDLCKEVRCIEIDESSASRNGRIHCLLTEESDALLPSITYVNDFEGQLETVTKLRGESDRDVRKIIEHFLKPFPHGPLPWPSMKLLSNSKSLCLAKSRSCKASLMNKSTNSAWFLEEENEKIILNCFLEASQPEGFQKDIFSAICNAENGGAPLEYGLQMSGTPSIDVLKKPDKDCNAEKEAPWEYGRQMSGKPSIDVLKPETVKIEPEEDVANICTFGAESKEKAKAQILEQPKDSQVVDQKDIVDTKIEKSEVEKSLDQTGPDVAENQKELSQHSSAEFERQQRDLVALWHVCNVSLVHRTYFFLLFKGDPADSIYMEVERRRLSFLRRVFSQGGSDKPLVVGIGDHITLASSMKALRRERRMLCRQMQKRLSAEERENLYRKWGIPLDSKKRKTQLISKLWSDTRNMDQIKESASVVATLIGLLEPDEALKEMFPMSFAPQMLIKGRLIQGRNSGTSSC